MVITGARMMLILLFVLAAACTPAPEVAEVIIVDGDTLRIDGERIRLHGIDAPEAGQTCARPDGGTWNCGASATAARLVRDGHAWAYRRYSPPIISRLRGIYRGRS